MKTGKVRLTVKHTGVAVIQAGFELLILLLFTILDYQGYRRSWKNKLSVPGIFQVMSALSVILMSW